MDTNAPSPADVVATSPPTAPTVPLTPMQVPQQNTTLENTSGMGDQSVVPEEIKGVSWGALFWNWIWAIGNKVWIGLLCLVPLANLVMIFVLFVKGRELAWKNKKWDSIEAFKKTQRNWAIWGLIIILPLFILGVVSLIGGVIFGLLLVSVNSQHQMQLANCIKNCPTTGDSQACIQNCQSNLQSPNTGTAGEVSNGSIGLQTVSPVEFSPTPTSTQVASPTALPTPVPTPVPTKAPSTKFQSTGTQTLENGVTGIVPSANLSANVVRISITFKNTSTSSQNAYIVHMQMHDQNLGEPPKENYFSVPLSPGESRTFNLSFDALPSPPFKIEYAAPSGLVNLGTYTP